MRRFDVVRKLLELQAGTITEEINITAKAHMTVRPKKKEKVDEISGFDV